MKSLRKAMPTGVEEPGDQVIAEEKEEKELSVHESGFQVENLNMEELESSSIQHYEIPSTRTVELIRDPKWNLGISIVGGRQNEGDDPKFKGIFIKHVLETCPAGKSGLLKTGDQILQVNDRKERNIYH